MQTETIFRRLRRPVSAMLLTLPIMLSVSAVSTAENLIKNPGFEEMDREGDFPRHWSKHHLYKGEYEVKADAALARSGSVSIGISRSGPEAHKIITTLWGRSQIRLQAERDFHLSVWIKGKGKFAHTCYLYGGRKTLRSISSPYIEIDSKEWKKYSWDITIPEKRKTDDKEYVVEWFCVNFSTKDGPIWLDDVSLYLKGSQPQEKPEVNNPKEESPYMTLVKTTKAPVIDGDIEDKEWEQASSVTGFLELGGKKIAKRQTLVYATFDEENLYFAFSCPHEGTFRRGEEGRDIKFGNQMESIEVRIQPPQKGWFQFLGVPAGGILDSSSKNKFSWNGDWKFRNKVEDVGETAGGVLLFNKKLWTAEVSISFKDLGVPAPKDGETWRMNFCRDFSVAPGKKRNPGDWTTWTGFFGQPKRFGYARFEREAPCLQIVQIGDLENGNLSVEGAATGVVSGEVGLQVTVALPDKKKVLQEVRKLQIEPGKPTKFSFSDTLRVAGTTEMELVIAAKDLSKGELLTQTKIPFTCLTSFRLKPVPIHTKDMLNVEIDVSRVADLPPDSTIDVGIYKPGELTALVSSIKQITEGRRKEKICLSISELRKGDYLIKGLLKDKEGNILASSTEPFPKPEKPSWLGNKIGISKNVPPPWTAVKTEGNRVKITQREYELADSGLPSQIISLGEEILNKPASLQAVVDGKKISWKFKRLKKIEQEPGQITWKIKGKGGPLNIDGKLRVEFDGFALWSIKIIPARKAKLDSLSLEFPLKRDFALHARAIAPGSGIESQYYSASLYRKTPQETTEKEILLGGRNSFRYSPAGWLWPESFCHEVWVGDDWKGFSIMCGTNENIRGNKYAEFISSGDEKRLRINLISEPVMLKTPIFYEYAYQATPVKPRPKNPKYWHAALTGKNDDLLKRLYVASAYHRLRYASYPELHNPKITARMIKRFHAQGAKIVPDFYLCMASNDTLEWKLYGGEWERIPRGGGASLRGGYALTCPCSNSHRDFMLYTVKRIVEEFGLDGVYVDVSDASACNNNYHGCGYQRPGETEWRPTVSLFALRELYKRLYTYLHTDGRDGVIFSHHVHEAAIAGFVDVVTQGEEWCVEREKQYTRLTPDMFRTREARTQYGTPFTWYTFHQYSWRGGKFATPVSFNEILAMCLLHRVLPTPGDPTGYEQAIPIWDLFDRWWTTSEFIPYWSESSPVKTKPHNVFASSYVKQTEKQALIVVSNWNYKDVKAEVVLDPAKFGFKNSQNLKLADALSGEDVPLEKGSTVYLNLPGRDLKLMIITCK